MSYEGARVPLHRLLFARQSPRDLYFGQLRRNMNHDQTMDDVETIYFVICNLRLFIVFENVADPLNVERKFTSSEVGRATTWRQRRRRERRKDTEAPSAPSLDKYVQIRSVLVVWNFFGCRFRALLAY